MDSPMPHPPPYPADDEAVTLVSAPTETPIETGQVWRDSFGNEFEVMGLRRDGRYALRHLEGNSARHIFAGELLANFKVLVSRPANSTQEETDHA